MDTITIPVKGPRGKMFPVILDADFADDFDPKMWYIQPKKGKPFSVKSFCRVVGVRPHRRNISASLHRVVAIAKRGDIVDHINRNPLDNRRCNLRIVPNGVNKQNSKLNANNQSGFKGVYFRKDMRTKPWLAQGNKEFGKSGHKHLGYFATKEEAARAYDKWTSAMYGEHAALNFPLR